MQHADSTEGAVSRGNVPAQSWSRSGHASSPTGLTGGFSLLQGEAQHNLIQHEREERRKMTGQKAVT